MRAINPLEINIWVVRRTTTVIYYYTNKAGRFRRKPGYDNYILVTIPSRKQRQTLKGDPIYKLQVADL